MADTERNEPVDSEMGPGETRPGKLRHKLSANSRKKPAGQRKRKRRVAHKPPASGAPKMPPGLSY
jgi:hypothetical protein